jgi:hypothetical protein
MLSCRCSSPLFPLDNGVVVEEYDKLEAVSSIPVAITEHDHVADLADSSITACANFRQNFPHPTASTPHSPQHPQHRQVANLEIRWHLASVELAAVNDTAALLVTVHPL